MADVPGYDIESILTSNDDTTTAFEDIRGLTERVTQQKMNVTPDPYVGPHYAMDDGLQIVRKYQAIIPDAATTMTTARRVESHWQEGYPTISAHNFWSGD